MVGLDLNPPWVEGIKNTVRLISLKLLSKGHRIYYLTKGSKFVPKKECIDSICYLRVDVGQSDSYASGAIPFMAKLPLALRKILISQEIDLVHTHSIYPAFGAFLGLLSSIFGVKSVFTLYSSTTLQERGLDLDYDVLTASLLKLSKNKIFIKGLRFVDKIIVTTNSSRRLLILSGIDENKVVNLRIGVDLSHFTPMNNSENVEIRNRLKIPESREIILFAGDVTPWKGSDIFLRAIKILREKRPNVLGIIMTKGLYEYEAKRRTKIEKLVDNLGIRDHVFFIGQHSSIREIYGISDLVVFPFSSFFFTMDTPLSLLEAMAMGKTVIVTNVGAFNEIISDRMNGILIDYDECALANAILELLDNKESFNYIGKNARRYIEINHNINSIIKDLEKIYADVVK
jgi:glycosyltransferase involved in cell wall biosynthesis